LLLALGVVGELVGHKLLDNASIGQSIVLGLSEALVISGLLALIVDPYLKKRIQDESGWNAVFGYLNPHAPSGLRDAIQELATCRQYHKRTHWSAAFAWNDADKAILTVTLEVRNTGIVLDPEPYKPAGRLWVLASTSGYQSEYLRYSLSCPDNFDSIDLSGEELQQYVVVLDDRSIYVDEERAVDGREIPPNVSYENLKKARMYRQPIGYIPLHHGIFGEHLSIELKGPALADLDINVAHPRREGRQLPAEWKRLAGDTANPGTRDFGRVVPGQVTLLSWSPSVAELRKNA
jgi:hypothetical protein